MIMILFFITGMINSLRISITHSLENRSACKAHLLQIHNPGSCFRWFLKLEHLKWIKFLQYLFIRCINKHSLNKFFHLYYCIFWMFDQIKLRNFSVTFAEHQIMYLLHMHFKNSLAKTVGVIFDEGLLKNSYLASLLWKSLY